MSQSVSLNHAKPDAADLVAAARHLGAIIRDRRDESERERRLPATVLSAMHDARLFRMYVPIEYGGLETDPITSMQVVEAVAEADAAAAWNLMIGATYGGLGSVLARGERARDLRREGCDCCRCLAA